MINKDKLKRGELKSLGTIDFKLDNEVAGCFVLTEGDTFIQTQLFTEDKPGHFGNKYHTHTITKPQPPEELYNPLWDSLTQVLGEDEGRKLKEVFERLDLKITKGEEK